MPIFGLFGPFSGQKGRFFMTINTIFTNGNFAELEVHEDFAFIVRTVCANKGVSSFYVSNVETTSHDGIFEHIVEPKEVLGIISMLIDEIYLQRRAIDALLNEVFYGYTKDAFFEKKANLDKLETALFQFVEKWIEDWIPKF